ncbi:ASCH domain-containing protein [Stella humosa]|uniref:ASCH domain-containing protein n=1 Tax=Stella humosa TaxID=94 RepID=A0A3N1MH47_9PROT|nr:ASCH domain-containing protein [Stella humosa]ROQ00486.1 ASCH domain-containing protein [Stella humosa]BBK30269.1 hypothetical protein STHU_09030 [Stella humosa]
MKALSIQQPWAWLISHGHKRVENRSWYTGYRGPLLIHAGLRVDQDGYEWVAETFPGIALPGPKTIARGGIVGQARLIACVNQRADDPWFFGPWGFVLTDVAALPFRPCRGQLGIFDAPPEAASAAA